MLNIAICDDENAICNQLENIILDISPKYNMKIEIDIFYTAENLYKNLLNKNKYDLIFLDIELKYMSGVQLGKKIREDINDQITQIIYISSKTSYAMELFSIRPLDFLIKPISTKKVDKTFSTAMKLIKNKNNFFNYQKEKECHRIPITDILYFESNNRQINIYTLNGKYSFYGTLKEIFNRLNDYGFVFIHRSYLININHVKIFKYNKVTLTDNTILNITQTFRKNLRELQMKIGEI
jgi:DNA-binding LytR/AlgR family response regulator